MSFLRTARNWSLQLQATASVRKIVLVSPLGENLPFSPRNFWLLWGVAGALTVGLVLSYSSTCCTGHHSFTCSQDAAPSLATIYWNLFFQIPHTQKKRFLSFIKQEQGFVLKPDISARIRIKPEENHKLFLLASVSQNYFFLTCANSEQNRNAGEYPESQKTRGNKRKDKLQTSSQLV